MDETEKLTLTQEPSYFYLNYKPIDVADAQGNHLCDTSMAKFNANATIVKRPFLLSDLKTLTDTISMFFLHHEDVEITAPSIAKICPKAQLSK